jgi:uncharacterized metal-binding protein YceD (DUF177 family)
VTSWRKNLRAWERVNYAFPSWRTPQGQANTLKKIEKNKPVWSVPVSIEDIPDAGLRLEIDAPGDVRTQIAELAAIRDLPKLSAVFDLSRQGAGVHVSGHVKAQVGQTCVVTLESVESALEEAIDLVFASTPTERATDADKEPPEPLVDGQVDLGALATEFLLLGIDPYPRKPGAEFAWPQAKDGGEHPFAALEGLKKRLGGARS